MRTMRVAAVACFLVMASVSGQQIRAKLLYDLVSERRAILPLVVELKTDGPFEGSVVVGQSLVNTQCVSRKINVGKGKFRFEMPLTLTSGTVPGTVTAYLVTTSGKTVASDAIPCSGPEYLGNEWLIAWVDAPTKFAMHTFTIESEMGEVEDEAYLDATALQSNSTYGTVYVRKVDHRALPRDWRMYRGLDAVVIGRGGAASMGRHELEALEKWVAGGGSLVVSQDAMDGAKGPFTDGFASSAQTVDGVAHHGLGKILVTSKAFSTSDKDSRTLCRDILQKHVVDTRLIGTVGIDYRRYLSNDYHTHWQEQLWTWLDLEQLSKKVLLSFIALFMVVAGILDRLVLKILKRRHWTWYTVPVIVVVFCYGAHKLSTISRGFQPRSTGVYVHDYGPDGSGLHHSLLCVTPATSRRISMATTDGWTIRHSGMDRTQDGTRSTLSLGDGVFNTSSAAWTPVFLESCALHRDKSPIEARFRREDDGYRCEGIAVPGSCGTVRLSYLLVGDHVFSGLPARGSVWGAVGDVSELRGRYGVPRQITDFVYGSKLFKLTERIDDYDYDYDPWEYDGYRNRRHADVGFVLASAAGVGDAIVSKDMLNSSADGRLAWLVVITDDGPGKDVSMGRPPKSKEIHVFRQLVRIERGDQ